MEPFTYFQIHGPYIIYRSFFLTCINNLFPLTYLPTNQPFEKKNPSLLQPLLAIDFPSDLFAGRLCSDVPTFVQYREARFARYLGDGGKIGGCRDGDIFLDMIISHVCYTVPFFGIKYICG